MDMKNKLMYYVLKKSVTCVQLYSVFIHYYVVLFVTASNISITLVAILKKCNSYQLYQCNIVMALLGLCLFIVEIIIIHSK